MQVINYPQRQEWKAILERPVIDTDELEDVVSQVFNEIKLEGDKAIKKYTWLFDKVKTDQLEVSQQEINEAEKLVDENLKNALLIASDNIRKFHTLQEGEIEKIETSNGVKCWRKSTSIERVGLYIPGGSAPLFSTVLMLGIPAKIAGCKEIILCTPPSKDGRIDPAILYACKLVGIDRVFRVGGIQAISGMAYGTESIPNVYKIFGPGIAFAFPLYLPNRGPINAAPTNPIHAPTE